MFSVLHKATRKCRARVVRYRALFRALAGAAAAAAAAACTVHRSVSKVQERVYGHVRVSGRLNIQMLLRCVPALM